MKIYFVRHGQTTGNVNDFYQTAETPLTEQGLNQAKQVAERLRSVPLDLIYTSTHLRARDTADIISKYTGVRVEEWQDLIEITRPKEVRGRAGKDPVAGKIMSQVKKNFGNPDWHYSDEENFFDLDNRASRVLEHLFNNHGSENIVCVSHGTFIRFMVSKTIFGKDLTPKIFTKMRYGMGSENTGVTILEKDKFGELKLLAWNDTSHL